MQLQTSDLWKKLGYNSLVTIDTGKTEWLILQNSLQGDFYCKGDCICEGQ